MQRILDLQSWKKQNGLIVVGSRCCRQERGKIRPDDVVLLARRLKDAKPEKAMGENSLSPMAFLCLSWAGNPLRYRSPSKTYGVQLGSIL